MADETQEPFGAKPITVSRDDLTTVEPDARSVVSHSYTMLIDRELAAAYGVPGAWQPRTREQRIADRERQEQQHAEQAAQRETFQAAYARLVEAVANNAIATAVLDAHRFSTAGESHWTDGCATCRDRDGDPDHWPCQTVQTVADAAGHPLPEAPWSWEDDPLPPFDPDAEDTPPRPIRDFFPSAFTRGAITYPPVVADDDESELVPPPTVCSGCGADPAPGLATIGDKRYCHGDGPGYSCYEKAGQQVAGIAAAFDVPREVLPPAREGIVVEPGSDADERLRAVLEDPLTSAGGLPEVPAHLMSGPPLPRIIRPPAPFSSDRDADDGYRS